MDSTSGNKLDFLPDNRNKSIFWKFFPSVVVFFKQRTLENTWKLSDSEPDITAKWNCSLFHQAVNQIYFFTFPCRLISVVIQILTAMEPLHLSFNFLQRSGKKIVHFGRGYKINFFTLFYFIFK